MAEKLELVSYIIMETKQGFLHDFVAKDSKKKRNDHCCCSNVS